MSLIPTVQHGAGVIIVWGLFSASVPVAAGETFLRWGCGTLTQQTISQTILHNKSNRQAELDPAPLPKETKFLLSNRHWSRDCTEFGSCPELITPESVIVT